MLLSTWIRKAVAPTSQWKQSVQCEAFLIHFLKPLCYVQDYQKASVSIK